MEKIKAIHQRELELASRIPPLDAARLHTLTSGGELPQFLFRRRCDRYLLAFCLSLLAVVASILWHTAPAGATPLNVAALVVAALAALCALRAARSLWLMRQTLRLRSRPMRMSRYADRLGRLSRHRRLWLRFVLRDGRSPASARQELVGLRLPSYSIAACLMLFVALNSDKAFAATRDYSKVTTNTGKTDSAICDTVNSIMAQL